MQLKRTVILFVLSIVSNVCFATTFYIDPANGSNSGDGSITTPWQTLEQVVNSNLIESRSFVTPYDSNSPQTNVINNGAPIKAGDTLMLYSGMHGELFLRNYINTAFITIKAVAGNRPIIKRIHFQAGRYWRLEGLTISSEPYGDYINGKLIFLETHAWQGAVSLIEIADCTLFSSDTAWATANDWLTKASDGIIVNADSIKLTNNSLTNIHFGISMKGDNIQVIGNTIKNFSGDGIRILGSNNLVESNIIKNCYSVDSNHDDGIQSFTSGGIVVDNNIVRRNIILNYEDPNQPLLGSLQGIGCFDGFFNNWIIENNLIIVDHWHGISFYGANNCQIINNTVLDPSPDVTPGPSWIKIEDFKNTASSNCIIKNNVSNSLSINPNSNSSTGNNTQLLSYSDYSNNFIDYINSNFHLIEHSPLIDNAELLASPSIDLDGVIRPHGITSDIGAYEYLITTSTVDFGTQADINIYPNPSITKIIIEGQIKNATINLFNVTGQLINSYSNKSLPCTIDLISIPKGVYFIEIKSNLTHQTATYKIIKN